MAYQVSIALVTRNRPDRLERVLASVREQSVQPFEVVVSDDSSNPEMINDNSKLAETFGCRYIAGPQKGLYANRNFVARHCRGTHFRTMDDDHTFPPHHFDRCLEAIIAEPETIWTIGEYQPNEMIREAAHPIPGQLHAKGYAYAPQNFSGYYGISCGGTIYPRSVLDKNILNTEFFKFGISYLEYGARLKYMGYLIKPLATTYLFHHNEETSASSLPEYIIEEARLFAMLSLSFKYQPLFRNKVSTVSQVLIDLVKGRYSVQQMRKVRKMLRETV